MKHGKGKYRIVEMSRDWKQSWDFPMIAKLMKGLELPYTVDVPDTSSDEYTMYLSSQPLTEDQAQELYEQAGYGIAVAEIEIEGNSYEDLLANAIKAQAKAEKDDEVS